MLKGLALVSTSLLAMTFAQAADAQETAGQGTTEQDAETSERANENVIMVTGTKIATDVQEVPIAITALTSETLEERQLTTFSEIGNVVPNATFRKSQGLYGAGVSVTLRGLGTTDTQFSQEPTVA